MIKLSKSGSFAERIAPTQTDDQLAGTAPAQRPAFHRPTALGEGHERQYQLLQKLARFNRERIPERVVHAKGWGAYGQLKITNDISKYSRAKCLQLENITKVFVRFSTVAGELGAADLERDVRGFAAKFYTEDGNWDLVGNNTPVFFIREPIKFPDLIRAQKRHSKTHLRCPESMWNFWSSSPESLHQVTILMSDRGLPVAPMYMNGYGAHTFSLINRANERHWVKFHFKSLQGTHHYTTAEAATVIGETRDSSQEDLYTSIEQGLFPRWQMYIQVMRELDAERSPFNPFDLTKVWPQSDYPLIEVGTLELNRNPNDYINEVEKSAFCPANIVPGIAFSPDKMLQARLVSYADAQHHRLGTDPMAYEVNRPQALAAPTHDDTPPLRISSNPEDYFNGPANDDFWQPRALFNRMSDEAKDRLFENIAQTMVSVSDLVVQRQLALFDAVHSDYGYGVRNAYKQMKVATGR